MQPFKGGHPEATNGADLVKEFSFECRSTICFLSINRKTIKQTQVEEQRGVGDDA